MQLEMQVIAEGMLDLLGAVQLEASVGNGGKSHIFAGAQWLRRRLAAPAWRLGLAVHQAAVCM